MAKRKNYGQIAAPLPVPQTQQADERQHQAASGGFVFTADRWTRLRRFLILGTEGGGYYVGERELTLAARDTIVECLKDNGRRVVDLAELVSQQGLAPKNDAAIWVLALAASPKVSDVDTAAYALEHMKFVCRTLPHLFQFCDMVQQTRGWGRALRTAVAAWFDNMDTRGVAYQAIKYRQRNGWTGGDVLRLAHAKPMNAEMNGLYRWITNGIGNMESRVVTRKGKTQSSKSVYDAVRVPSIVYAFESAMQIKPEMINGLPALLHLIEEHELTWEMVPTEWLTHAAVWKALIPNMPYKALMRNVANMTRAGVFEDKNIRDLVIERLGMDRAIQRERIHPVDALVAALTYEQGKGMRGTNTWEPVRGITNVLNDAFYKAFKNVKGSGKNILVAIDVSSSMSAQTNGMPYLNCFTAAAAMALMLVNIEPDADVMAFHTSASLINLNPRNTLQVTRQYIQSLPSGGTDVGCVFQWGIDNHRKYDAVIVFTDQQTWAGGDHVYKTVQQYRQRVNADAKVVVCAMEANEIRLADPDDTLTLEIAGLDSSVPRLIEAFLQGAF